MASPANPGKVQHLPMLPIDDAGFPSDETRAQELDRYYNPSEKSSLRLTDKDTALVAHMQLVAWRLDAQRACMTLVNRDAQYFIVECTKTVDLLDIQNLGVMPDGPLPFVCLP